MEILEAMRNRHSVRAYTDRKIDENTLAALRAEIDACNREGGLHFQLVTGEPKAFGGRMAHYGHFSGVHNYIALIGRKAPNLEEKIGYYGERLVLLAQTLGLNTCWVALTYSKSKARCTIDCGEKLVCVLALGYGATQGVPHKSKAASAVSRCTGEAPAWFTRGVEAALLAPTAVNQQSFLLTLHGDQVLAKSTGGFYAKVDLGIVKYHFELAAGRDHFRWG